MAGHELEPGRTPDHRLRQWLGADDEGIGAIDEGHVGLRRHILHQVEGDARGVAQHGEPVIVNAPGDEDVRHLNSLPRPACRPPPRPGS